MRANALKATNFTRYFVGKSSFAVILLGTLIVGLPAIEATAADEEPVKKVDPLLEEDRVHKLSIFSYMQPLTKGGRSTPVLVTLDIIGPEGLSTFCEYRPMIHEAVLNVVTDDQVSTGNRTSVLADMKIQILEAVNYSLPGTPVSSVDARPGRSVSEFGKDIVQTRSICRKLDSLIR